MVFIPWAVKGTTIVNINLILGLYKIAIYNYQVIHTRWIKTEMPPTFEFDSKDYSLLTMKHGTMQVIVIFEVWKGIIEFLCCNFVDTISLCWSINSNTNDFKLLHFLHFNRHIVFRTDIISKNSCSWKWPACPIAVFTQWYQASA